MRTSDRSRKVRLGLMGIDLATIVVVSAVATVAFIQLNGDKVSLAWVDYATILALSLPGWLIAFHHARLYSARFLTRGVDEGRRLISGVAIGVTFLALASVALRVQIERGWYVLIGIAVFAAVGIERAIMRRVFNRWRRSGRLLRRIVLVGDNFEADELEVLLRDPSLGYSVVGRVSAECERNEVFALDIVTRTLQMVNDERATGVVVAASAMNFATSAWLIRELTESGVHVELSSALLDIAPNRITVRSLGRLPVLYVEPVHRDGWRARAKRSFDVVFSATLLVLTAPLVLICGVALKLTSSGPMFFRQSRVGRDGKAFTMYKLRTMVANAEDLLGDLHDQNELDGPLFKITADPRITKVGRLLRKASIDELPQLWNVLRGDMAMVGPRPALLSEVEQWPPHAFQRLRVKPGLTGMWQVHGRSLTLFEDYIRLDVYYVDNWSLFTDLGIIGRTVPIVLGRRGAC